MTALIEMVGKRFGKMTVLARAANNRTGQSMWTCRCDCGNTKDARGVTLRNGTTASCGCEQFTKLRTLALKTGAKSRANPDPALRKFYEAWCGMKARCTNPKHKDYKYYGARGISVCDEWQEFENFKADMWPRPEGKTLDRIDANKGYSKGNCRWATHLEQRHNQRRCSE